MPVNSISFITSGDDYRPSALGIEFSSQHDAGEPRKYGVGRIGPYPSGVAVIKAILAGPWEDSIRAFVDLVEKTLPDMKEAGGLLHLDRVFF